MQKWAVIPWQDYSQEDGDNQSGGGEQSLSADSILIGIPKQGRRDAAAILHHIQNSPGISWNLRGEIVLDGTPVENSHITDLLKYSLFHYKTWKPVGVEEFYHALADSNLPTGLIRSQSSRSLLEKIKTSQPPGIRTKKTWLTWD